MFRVVLMFVAAGALVAVVTVLVSSLAGALVALVLIGVGLWRTWGLIQDWRRYGSDPER